jgi:S1-C subfamily serine protease
VQVPSLGKDRFEAEVVGCCPYKDVAVLKIKEKDLEFLNARVRECLGYTNIPFLELGSSDGLSGAQEIMALGYPLGQENQKSSIGVFSGPQNVSGRNLMQTTTPFNPGNSGGSCFDAFGTVVGIVVANIPGSQNIGYFIPISDVKHIIHGFIEGRYQEKIIKAPVWGVYLQTTTKQTLDFFGVPNDGGVRVGKIIKNALFDKYGIQTGDFVYKFNGIKIDRYGYIDVDWCQERVHLYEAFDRLDLGDSFILTVYQKNQQDVFEEKEIEIIIESYEPFAIYEKYPSFEYIDYEMFGGLVVMELTVNHLNVLIQGLKENVLNYNSLAFPHVLKYIDMNNRHESVLIITHIFAGSVFERVRCFEVWDIIRKVNGVEVGTLQDFRNALQDVVQNEYVTIETHDGSYASSKLEDIVNEEPYLAQVHGYTMSQFVIDLDKKFFIDTGDCNNRAVVAY